MLRRKVRCEDGFTLVELLVVMIIIAVLVSIAAVFHYGARERASDATAKANIRTAVPAIEAYRGDFDGYAGMDIATLKSTYSPGIGSIVVEWSIQDDYCISSTVGDRSWWKQGPSGQITTTSC